MVSLCGVDRILNDEALQNRVSVFSIKTFYRELTVVLL
jgi:hypothetical protein